MKNSSALLEAPIKPDSAHPNTLGFTVVRLAAETLPPEEHKETADKELKNVRTRLSGLTPENQDLLENYCARIVPWGLKKDRGKHGQNSNWTTWLGTKANDGELTKFLRWHVEKIESQQAEPAAQTAIEIERLEYKAGIKKGVKDGWLHDDALGAVDKVDGIAVYVGDIFDMVMQERGGYHVRGSNHIVVGGANTFSPLKRAYRQSVKRGIKWATKHEFNHAVLGSLGQPWMDEALTEHIAQVIDNGDPEQMYPDRREHNRSMYTARRTLLADVLTKGRQEIPASLATRAYSETRDLQSPTRDAFLDAIEASWGHHKKRTHESSLTLINRHVSRLEKEYKAQGKTTIQAQDLAAAHASRDLLDNPQYIFAAEPYPKNLRGLVQRILPGR